VITGIDGYRSIAHRTGLYAGRDQTKFAFTKDGKIFSATVTVNKIAGGQKVPYTATVFYDEAVQTNYKGEPNTIWSKRPKGQLDKCAEAAALRMAFPDDLAGMYVEEEFTPTPQIEQVEEEKGEIEPSTEKQQEYISQLIKAIAESSGKEAEHIKTNLYSRWSIESTRELNKEQAKTAIEQLLRVIEGLEKDRPKDGSLIKEGKPITKV
jgi:transcription termination factor NusB